MFAVILRLTNVQQFGESVGIMVKNCSYSGVVCSVNFNNCGEMVVYTIMLNSVI